MNEAWEPVEIRGPSTTDDFGHVSTSGDSVTVTCRVQPLVLAQDVGVDREGVFETLRVFAPAGTVVRSGCEVKIRGEWFTVLEPPHNFAEFRRPALGRHRPSLVFTCSRGEG